MGGEVGVVTSTLIISIIISYTTTVISNWFIPFFGLIPSYTLWWSNTPQEIFTEADRTSNEVITFFAYYFWNVLTYVFVETTFVIGFTFIFIVFVISPIVEKSMGSYKFAIMLFVITLLTGMITCLGANLLSVLRITNSNQRVYCGMWPLIEAILIYVIQIKGMNSNLSTLITANNNSNININLNNKLKRMLNRVSYIKIIHIPEVILLFALFVDMKRWLTREMTYDTATTTTKRPEVQGRFQAQNRLGTVEIREFGSVFILSIFGLLISWMWIMFTKEMDVNMSIEKLFYPAIIRKCVGKISAIGRVVMRKSVLPPVRRFVRNKEFVHNFEDVDTDESIENVNVHNNSDNHNENNNNSSMKTNSRQSYTGATTNHASEKPILPAPLYGKKLVHDDTDAERHRTIALAALNRRMQEQQQQQQQK